jgi:hypothetical protein
MPFTPVKGKLCAIAIGNSSSKKAGINWSLAIDPKNEDLSNFRDGRQRFATLEDCIATFTVVQDEDDSILSSATRPGALISASFFVTSSGGSAQCFSGTFRVGQFSPKVDGMESHLKVDVTAELHGSLTYPV